MLQSVFFPTNLDKNTLNTYHLWVTLFLAVLTEIIENLLGIRKALLPSISKCLNSVNTSRTEPLFLESSIYNTQPNFYFIGFDLGLETAQKNSFIAKLNIEQDVLLWHGMMYGSEKMRSRGSD